MKKYSLIIAFISAALFGAATPASKILLEDFSPFQLAGLLYLGGILGVLGLYPRTGKMFHEKIKKLLFTILRSH